MDTKGESESAVEGSTSGAKGAGETAVFEGAIVDTKGEGESAVEGSTSGTKGAGETAAFEGATVDSGGESSSKAVKFVFSSFLRDMRARTVKDFARMITSARAHLMRCASFSFCRRSSSIRARFALFGGHQG